MPDIEQRVVNVYGDQVSVIAIDANGDELEGLKSYVNNLTIGYPVGREDLTTPTYKALTENFKGANPFPVDVVVGKYGTIRYIAREYDPDGLVEAIDEALAE